MHHERLSPGRQETGARLAILLLALLPTGVTLLTFVFTTLITEPASIATLVGVLVVSIALDVGRARVRDRRAAGA